MVTDDKNDIAYAKALKALIAETGQYEPYKIENEFLQIGTSFFPDYDGPKNVMLQEIFWGVVHDELTYIGPDNDPKDTLERFKTLVTDYLAGNFYPSYFVLSGTYSADNSGYGFYIVKDNGVFKVTCGNENISNKLNKVADSIVLTQDDATDFETFQKELPESVEDTVLASCGLQEFLSA